jgi:hypothetical protein
LLEDWGDRVVDAQVPGLLLRDMAGRHFSGAGVLTAVRVKDYIAEIRRAVRPRRDVAPSKHLTDIR